MCLMSRNYGHIYLIGIFFGFASIWRKLINDDATKQRQTKSLCSWSRNLGRNGRDVVMNISSVRLPLGS